MAEKDLGRRSFLFTAGIAGATLVAGCSSDGGDGDGDGGDGDGGDGGDGEDVPSEVEEYLSGAQNYEGEVTDATGEDNPTVDVGAGNGLAFDPAAIRVSEGTTVTWVWTGDGGGHNVVHEDGDFESGDPVIDEGHEFEYTFDESGNYLYFCDPHEASGMKGAVIVE